MTSESPPVHSNNKQINLWYLFLTFLKVGTVSFGGNMALISVVKNIMVDRDKTLRNDVILDGVSIGSLLPGPMAVNVVAYIGYTLKRSLGAIVSIVAILLPAVIAMLILSWLYYKLGLNEQFGTAMRYITVVVAALIFATALQFFDHTLKRNGIKTGIAIVGAVMVMWSSSFAITLLLLFAGGGAGWLLKLSGRNNPVTNVRKEEKKKISGRQILMWIVLCVLLLIFISGAYNKADALLLKIFLVFSGISLSLFGGGYVMIPIMQSLFVNDLLWLNHQEFVDAIALSQLTPGPILVSATFIGYKLYGFTGAILATGSIFVPSSILMIKVSKIYDSFSHLVSVKHVLAGVKAVVIGLIAGAAIKIGMQVSWNIPLGLTAIISFVLLYYYKINPVFIILSGAFAGLALWYFNVV